MGIKNCVDNQKPKEQAINHNNHIYDIDKKIRFLSNLIDSYKINDILTYYEYSDIECEIIKKNIARYLVIELDQTKFILQDEASASYITS